MKVLYCYAADFKGQDTAKSASVGYRCRIPAVGLTRAGHEASLMSLDAFVTQTQEVVEKCADADLMVVQRSIWRDDVWRVVRKWQGRGKPVALELDDSPQHKPASVGGASILWRQHHVIEGKKIFQVSRREVKAYEREGIKVLPPAIQAFRERLPQMDAVTVPSTGLLRDWEKRAKRIFLLRNFYDPGNVNWSKKRGNLGGVIVGWMGSQSHLQSWGESGLFHALPLLCRRCPEVKVMIFGDRRVAERLSLPKGRLLHHDWIEFERYPQTLRYFDVGLAPLAGAYGQRKSDQKIAVDYPLMRIPWVASNWGPYKEHGEAGGFLVKKSWEWVARMRELVEDEETRQAKAEEGHEAALGRSIDVGINDYVKAYREIVKEVSHAGS